MKHFTPVQPCLLPLCVCRPHTKTRTHAFIRLLALHSVYLFLPHPRFSPHETCSPTNATFPKQKTDTVWRWCWREEENRDKTEEWWLKPFQKAKWFSAAHCARRSFTLPLVSFIIFYCQSEWCWNIKCSLNFLIDFFNHSFITIHRFKLLPSIHFLQTSIKFSV